MQLFINKYENLLLFDLTIILDSNTAKALTMSHLVQLYSISQLQNTAWMEKRLGGFFVMLFLYSSNLKWHF